MPTCLKLYEFRKTLENKSFKTTEKDLFKIKCREISTMIKNLTNVELKDRILNKFAHTYEKYDWKNIRIIIPKTFHYTYPFVGTRMPLHVFVVKSFNFFESIKHKDNISHLKPVIEKIIYKLKNVMRYMNISEVLVYEITKMLYKLSFNSKQELKLNLYNILDVRTSWIIWPIKNYR